MTFCDIAKNRIIKKRQVMGNVFEKFNILRKLKEQRRKELEYSASDNSSDQNIIGRLDLQLLLAVIVFFVSAWAYLNKTICEFTGSEPIRVQMCYIVVHYVLTLVLFLCIYITCIKGLYLVNKKMVGNKRQMFFKLFMYSWYLVLIICLIFIAASNFIPWIIVVATLSVLFVLICYIVGFSFLKTIAFVIFAYALFPIFISTLTLVDKKIDIVVDKEYYSLDENVIITVNSQGYACHHVLVCLGKENLYPNTKYNLEKNMIVLKASTIKDKNNAIAVGTISPANGKLNFVMYPFWKMKGESIEYLKIIDPSIIEADTSSMSEYASNMQYVYFKTKNINIRP